MLDALGAKSLDTAIAQIRELRRSVSYFSKIQSVFPSLSASNIVEKINIIRSENNRLNADLKRILSLLFADPKVDISKTIQQLIENQKKSADEVNIAGTFISDVLHITTSDGSNKVSKFVFSMKNSDREKLLEVVTRIRRKSDENSVAVESIIEHSWHFGYSGHNLHEASRAIVEGTEGAKYIKSPTIQSPSAHQTELLKAKKQISVLRESLAKQIEKSSLREEELLDENKRLQEMLSKEKLVPK